MLLKVCLIELGVFNLMNWKHRGTIEIFGCLNSQVGK